MSTSSVPPICTCPLFCASRVAVPPLLSPLAAARLSFACARRTTSPTSVIVAPSAVTSILPPLAAPPLWNGVALAVRSPSKVKFEPSRAVMVIVPPVASPDAAKVPRASRLVAPSMLRFVPFSAIRLIARAASTVRPSMKDTAPLPEVALNRPVAAANTLAEKSLRPATLIDSSTASASTPPVVTSRPKTS